ncbi:hypothetical protein CVT26_002786 [Gymnopilus dilepis]|uniref:Uncharacterized protein n=1 Tax=Gymnopilus dilepis TaxID=231916 RepID=A0A409Y3C8_9AGAR|nr:hypothetical protein CVT26_002786 [Gymnopilus dilepis]
MSPFASNPKILFGTMLSWPATLPTSEILDFYKREFPKDIEFVNSSWAKDALIKWTTRIGHATITYMTHTLVPELEEITAEADMKTTEYIAQWVKWDWSTAVTANFSSSLISKKAISMQRITEWTNTSNRYVTMFLLALHVANSKILHCSTHFATH